MGLIERVLTVLFGGGRNVVRDTAEVFWGNAEAQAMRDAALRSAALSQFGAEFAVPRRGWFDRLMDGLNRLPRPALALGTLGLFVSAMVDPVWFSTRMQGIALVPEPLWWLLGGIVSFYFGARHQAKSFEFQRAMGQTVARTAQVTRNIAALQALEAGAGGAGGHRPAAAPAQPAAPGKAVAADANPALEAWRKAHGG